MIDDIEIIEKGNGSYSNVGNSRSDLLKHLVTYIDIYVPFFLDLILRFFFLRAIALSLCEILRRFTVMKRKGHTGMYLVDFDTRSSIQRRDG